MPLPLLRIRWNTRLSAANPVDWHVAERVGVHEQAAVTLVDQQVRRERQVRTQPARVVDGTAGDDESHRSRQLGGATALGAYRCLIMMSVGPSQSRFSNSCMGEKPTAL